MTIVTEQLSPSDIVVFGGTGDLSLRKIVPALYYRLKDEQLHPQSRVFLLGRTPMTRKEHLESIRKTCQNFIAPADLTTADWKRLEERLFYFQVDAKESGAYAELKKALEDKPRTVRVFYLSTPANIFGAICENLHKSGMVTEHTRVVLEKPIGYDLASFNEINNAVLRCFREKQIYRIDHYLGKETVQNLMVLRFANNVFERIWTGDAIDHVQITVAEDIGIGERAGYYDDSGALRDMVQNHLLQLLCLTAMEAPATITADTVRDEKLKVLRALRPILPEDIAAHTVRGQYRDGAIGGVAVRSYLDDLGKKESDTETFVAIKAHVDNWRWSGIPFYLRTGKRMFKRYSEIVIQFKQVPHNIFPGQDRSPASNKLIIRLQPDESVKFQMVTKVPGPGGYRLKPVNLNLSLSEEFNERYPDAYERLLMDVVRGNQTLFMRTDEVEAAWLWTEHLLNGWKKKKVKASPYQSGSWGPEDSYGMIAHDGRNWHQE